MATLSTTPVVFCRVCGVPLVVHAETFQPGSELLDVVMKTAAQYALCEYHRQQMMYYSQLGRIKEWEEGNL